MTTKAVPSVQVGEKTMYLPYIDLIPISDEDDKALGDSIEEDGAVNEPVVTNANKRTPTSEWVVDGAHRCVHAARLGLKTIPIRTRKFASEEEEKKFGISANKNRRQLNHAQKLALVAVILTVAPEKSNRGVAKDVNVDHKTVATVRDDMEGRGEIPHVSNRTDSVGRQQPAHKPKPPTPDATAPVPEREPGDDTTPPRPRSTNGKVTFDDRKIDEMIGKLARLFNDRATAFGHQKSPEWKNVREKLDAVLVAWEGWQKA